jgi:hypothetical protein
MGFTQLFSVQCTHGGKQNPIVSKFEQVKELTIFFYEGCDKVLQKTRGCMDREARHNDKKIYISPMK